MKRGITPIIAIILLLMMTVAVSGAMFYWLSRVQGQTQGAVESFQSNLFTNIASEVSIIEANYNDTLEQLHIFLHNTGNTQITLDNSTTYPTTDWILFDSDREAYQRFEEVIDSLLKNYKFGPAVIMTSRITNAHGRSNNIMKLKKFIKNLERIKNRYGDDLEVTMADYIPVPKPVFLSNKYFGKKVVITDKE